MIQTQSAHRSEVELEPMGNPHTDDLHLRAKLDFLPERGDGSELWRIGLDEEGPRGNSDTEPRMHSKMNSHGILIK